MRFRLKWTSPTECQGVRSSKRRRRSVPGTTLGLIRKDEVAGLDCCPGYWGREETDHGAYRHRFGQ